MIWTFEIDTDDDFDFSFDGGQTNYCDNLILRFDCSILGYDPKFVLAILDKIELLHKPGKDLQFKDANEAFKQLKRAVQAKETFHKGGNFTIAWKCEASPDYSYIC
jgi:hypothetical protein